MKQMARNLTDAGDGFLNETRYLIHDRDPLFTEEFRQVLRSGGVKTVKLPAQSPDLNAYAERLVRSIREECLSRVIPLGERHLRGVVGEYVKHYHLERNHQGLGNELIEPSSKTGQGRVACRHWLSHGSILSRSGASGSRDNPFPCCHSSCVAKAPKGPRLYAPRHTRVMAGQA